MIGLIWQDSLLWIIMLCRVKAGTVIAHLKENVILVYG